MKTLIAILLIVLVGAISAQTINTHIALWVGVSDMTDAKSYDITKARADMRQGCIEAKALSCNLIVVERDGRKLATMDLDGNWTEYASKQEIADVLATALQRSNMPMPTKKDLDALLIVDTQ